MPCFDCQTQLVRLHSVCRQLIILNYFKTVFMICSLILHKACMGTSQIGGGGRQKLTSQSPRRSQNSLGYYREQAMKGGEKQLSRSFVFRRTPHGQVQISKNRELPVVAGKVWRVPNSEQEPVNGFWLDKGDSSPGSRCNSAHFGINSGSSSLREALPG